MRKSAIMQSRIPRGSCREEVHDGGPRMALADILYPPLAFGQCVVRVGSRSRVRDPRCSLLEYIAERLLKVRQRTESEEITEGDVCIDGASEV